MPSRGLFKARLGDYIQILYGLIFFFMSIGTLGLADHFEVLKGFLDFFLKQGDLLQTFCGFLISRGFAMLEYYLKVFSRMSLLDRVLY